MGGKYLSLALRRAVHSGNGDAKLDFYPAHQIAAIQMRLNIGTSQQSTTQQFENDENDKIRTSCAPVERLWADKLEKLRRRRNSISWS